ncbi:MAG: helix-turn-helix domain-containing protein [Desulfitobacteriia bacterium]
MKKKLDFNQEELNIIQTSLQAVQGREELFFKIIEHFPYPLEVFARDGTAVMVNRAMLAQFGIQNIDMIIGKYNIFRDLEVQKSGMMDLVRKVFQGQSITLTNVRVPVKSIKKHYKIENLDIGSMYQDLLGFPIKDEQGEVSHVIILFITRKVYKGKANIIKAIEYLEQNWNVVYNLNEVAKVAKLSPSHFSRVFKSEMGITPYHYYQKLKIEHLMEKLNDTTISVKEAFKACGLKYSGQSFTIFKKHVGVTPSQYRETISKIKQQ